MKISMVILPQLARSDAAELLDGPTVDQDALVENLHDLRQVDRYLGSTRLTWKYLLPMLRKLPHGATTSLLDVATGGGEGPRKLMALARREGYVLQPIASDRLGAVLRIARTAGVPFPLIQHDALAIPIVDSGVDFVTCSLALHHFDPDAAVGLLRELCRVARYGVVVNDLRRSRPAYWAARLLALGPWHAMAQHDGPISVLRAYTRDETQALVVRAQLAHARVEAQPLFRIVVVIDRTAQTGDAADQRH